MLGRWVQLSQESLVISLLNYITKSINVFKTFQQTSKHLSKWSTLIPTSRSIHHVVMETILMFQFICPFYLSFECCHGLLCQALFSKYFDPPNNISKDLRRYHNNYRHSVKQLNFVLIKLFISVLIFSI